MTVLLLSMALAGCAHAGPRMLPFELEDANEAHEPLVVELGASWCAPCKVFTTNVLPDPRVQAALAGIRFVRYDVDTAAGRDAARRIGISGVPTVVGIDRGGRVRIYKRGTEQSADNFLEFLREVHAVLDVH